MKNNKTEGVAKFLGFYCSAIVVIVIVLVPVCLVIALAISKAYDFLKGIS